MKRVLQAAPPQIVSDATVVRMQDDAMADPEKGNQRMDLHVIKLVCRCVWTRNAMEWAHAWKPRPGNRQDRVHLYAGR